MAQVIPVNFDVNVAINVAKSNQQLAKIAPFINEAQLLNIKEPSYILTPRDSNKGRSLQFQVELYLPTRS